jgi:nucleotide-binding universal stress UspA family protein
MTSKTTFEPPPTATKRTPLGRRVLVGVDGSESSMEAARQAAFLIEPDGASIVLSAWRVPHEERPEDARDEAVRAVAEATRAFAGQREPLTRVVPGVSWQELLQEANRQAVTLLAVGSNGVGRLRGIVVGSTTTELIHKAPCSVLIARPAREDFPRRVVVGVDGSPESVAAYTVACDISERSGAELRPLVAHGGEPVDDELVTAIVGYRCEHLGDEPVRALVVASTEVDLVVVGSRGLQGLKSLGSVSERVAHEAHCSTLIVRPG